MTARSAARSAVGPMVAAAIEQNEPPDRRLVDDDLAEHFLPTRMRWLVAATRWSPLRRVLIAATERSRPGVWANLTCRKSFVGDKLDDALGEIDAVVILGSGLDTRAYQLTRRVRIPIFEVDLPVAIARKVTTVRHVLGTLPLSVRLAALDFERDDVLTALAEHGYHTDYRTFFIFEGVTHYLTADAVGKTLEGLRAAASGSRLVFTYLRRDAVDDTSFATRPPRRWFRRRRRAWRFGLDPAEAGGFLAAHGWRLVEQVGPDELQKHYIAPAGRTLAASDIAWSAYAEKQ